MHLALETIDYQIKDSFPPALVSLVEQIYDLIDRKKLRNTSKVIGVEGYTQEIEKLIKSRLGMNVKFTKELHVFAPAAIIPFFGDYFRNAREMSKFKAGKGQSLFSFSHKAMAEYKELEKHRKQVMKKLDGRTGHLDTKTAKVSGYLSDIPHYLIADFVWMKDYGITPSETTAILLHELGHAFDGLEEHNRVEQTNRSIYDVLSELNDRQYEKAGYVFRSKFTKEEFEQAMLEDEAKRHDFCGKLAKAYLGEVKSQITNAKYNETNFENMADTFAVRFGMGKDLASGLHKLMVGSGYVLPNSNVLYSIGVLMDIMVGAASFIVFPVYGAIVFWAVIFMIHNSDTMDMTYDLPMDRYNRVKNSIVNGLKRRNLPKEVVQEFLQQYEYLSTVLDTFMAPESLQLKLADFIIPAARESKYYSDLQKSIENSLNNDLFVKSAQLKVL